jgi:hypothetical protein
MSDLISLCVLDIILSSSFGVDTGDFQTSKDTTLLDRAKTLFNRPFLIVIVSLVPGASFLANYVDVFGNARYFMDLARLVSVVSKVNPSSVFTTARHLVYCKSKVTSLNY